MHLDFRAINYCLRHSTNQVPFNIWRYKINVMEYKKIIFKDGKIKSKTVYDLHECLNSIAELCRDKDDDIKQLREENNLLKTEHYKDDVISELKKENQELKHKLRNFFCISDDERNEISMWKKSLDEKYQRQVGAIGGGYKYIFVPTSIGTLCKIVTSDGKFEFVFRDIK